MSLDVIFEILNLVNSPVTHRTLEPGHLVMDKRMFPMSVYSEARLFTHRTYTGKIVPVCIILWDTEVDVLMLDMVGDKLRDAGESLLTRAHVTSP